MAGLGTGRKASGDEAATRPLSLALMEFASSVPSKEGAGGGDKLLRGASKFSHPPPTT